MRKTCLIHAILSNDTKNQIKRMLSEYELIMHTDPETTGFEFSNIFTVEQLHRANIIIGNPTISALSYCDNLEWLQTISSRADKLTSTGLLDKNTIVTTVRGVYDNPLSEFVVGAVFALSKNLNIYHDLQKAHRWEPAGKMKTIYGSNVLILGAGHIGGAVGRKLYALGANIHVIRAHTDIKSDYMKSVHSLDALDDIIGDMDYVILCLPSVGKTVLSKKQFALMKNDAIVVNVARGELIDTDDLTRALLTGEIGGAALDVVKPEPLQTNHPLWNVPNCLFSMHSGTGFDTNEAQSAREKIILDNIRNYLNGDDMTNSAWLQAL